MDVLLTFLSCLFSKFYICYLKSGSVKFDHVKLTGSGAAVSAGGRASGGGSVGGGVSDGRQSGAGQY